MRKTYSLFLFPVLAISGSCISNDIPYPNVNASIVSIEADFAKSTAINSDDRTVLVTLEEAGDISKVNIRKVEFNDEAVSASEDITGLKDLSSPLSVTLSAYGQSRDWAIKATQPVERYFTVTGQIGETAIDAENKRIIFSVPSGTDLKNLTVLTMKLGPEGLTACSPSAKEMHDFSDTVTVKVTYRDVTERWTIYAEEVESAVTMTAPDVWTRVAWLKASGLEDRSNGFRIRESGSAEWKEVEDVTRSGGTFSAATDGLEPLTEYECCAYSGEDVSEIFTFTTEAELQIPNGGFETFSNDESSKYCSFYDPRSTDPTLRTKWWGSGNKGSTTVGSSYAITKPDGTDKMEGEYSLKMESMYVIIKFAAGNVFSGEYGGNVGVSGGKVRMGRPFTLRPRKLTLWLKYKCGKIQEKTLGGFPEGDEVKVGDNDRGIVWIALGTWDSRTYGGTEESPVEVNTADKSTFFDPQGKDVVAYGKYVTDKDTDWTKVEIPLEYVSTSIRPTHIIISCAASMLGDYFTGSPDSILWVDGMQLEY